MTAALPVRALTATLVVVGSADRLAEVVRVLGTIDRAGGVRSVLIYTDRVPEGEAGQQEDVVAMSGIKPEHVNNAIAAVRLSSLPTVVWWRGGEPSRLEGVASLADRVILDDEAPLPLWTRAPALFERTAITDLRWARLTRWRAVMAHFFDMPQIREASADFTNLRIVGRDRAECTLFAGWLDASLGWEGRVAVELVDDGEGTMSSVGLTGTSGAIRLERLANGSCLKTESRRDHHVASRVVSLGDQRLPTLIAEELRVRSRDLAFERALAATAFLGL
jgi:glucose-6-phosphate dehydrogenase assembly protein OpcA